MSVVVYRVLKYEYQTWDDAVGDMRRWAIDPISKRTFGPCSITSNIDYISQQKLLDLYASETDVLFTDNSVNVTIAPNRVSFLARIRALFPERWPHG